jgi:hypothetical protein
LRFLLRCGRRKKTASWAGREAEAQWREGERPIGKKKEVGRGWAERPDGPAGRWADWAESEGKIISE